MINNIEFNYNHTGDIITVAMCIMLIILINSTYIRNDKMFKMFKVSMFTLIMSSLTNLSFHYLLDKHIDINVNIIYTLRNSHYTSLILVLLLYSLYVAELVDLKRKKIYTIVYVCVYFLGTILECITPITHFGFYIDKNGIGHENYFASAFTFVYIYFITSIVIMIFVSYKNILNKIIKNLMMIMFLSLATMGLQYFTHSTTYSNFTFLLPIISVLFLFHNNTYDAQLLALDVKAFSTYIDDLGSKNKKFTVCSFYINNVKDSNFVNNIFLTYYKTILNDAYLFKINDKKIVIIYNGLNKSKEEKAKKIFEKILKEINTKNLIFKMVIVRSNEFLYKNEQYIKFTKHIETGMKNKTYYIVQQQDIDSYKTQSYIIDELQDICTKNNLDDERVLVYCQPIFNVKTNEYDTAESLMRLDLKETGIIYPDTFIQLAENKGYIHTLSKIILNKVCKEIKLLEQEGYDFKRISINFVTDELKEENFVSEINEIITVNNIDSSKIGVEITESEKTENFNKLIDTINKLRNNNLTVYIDDFGTGYSNFVKTLAIPIDVIKFDKSLVSLSQNSSKYNIMVAKFADIFSELNYSILFEGIETKEEEETCIKMNANYLQGYKYSKPIPINELRRFFKKQV